MSRYIDADKIHNELVVRVFNAVEGITGTSAEWALEPFKNAPTADVVEVVRCRDCKYAEHWYGNEFDCRCPVAPWASDEYAMVTNENDFCSYGRRAEK